MKIKAILWDIDGTVLNFLAAEEVAIRKGFKRLNFGECTDAMLSDYSAINHNYWKALERGEYTKPEILVKRFEDFFGKYRLDTSLAGEFNTQYQYDLGETICFNDNAYELVEELKVSYKQYAATNGTAIAQHKKLSLSGLDKLLDGFFISDEIGFEKPSKEFFKFVFEKLEADLGPVNPDEVIIIGDSLTSDMRGGVNAGIKTCWYNPNAAVNDSGLSLDYEISNLNQIKEILNKE